MAKAMHSDHTFVTTPRMSTYLVALIAGPYARWSDTYSDEHGDIPLGLYLPLVAGRVHGPRTTVHPDQTGIRLLPQELWRAVCVRKVRPAVRARIQRGRDGECGRGDVPGGLRLPQQGHPRVLRAACRNRAARDGAHVVRRPRHDAVVGRPVAQRVVRDVRLGAVPGRSDRVHRGVDDIRERGEVVGLPPGPAAVDAPGGRRHPGPGRRRGELRRHHIRQGRQRAQATRRLRRAGGVPLRPAGLLPRPRLRQRHLRRPARCAGEGVGPRPVRLGAAVAQDHRAQHAAPRLRPRRRRAVHPLRDHPERCAAGRR